MPTTGGSLTFHGLLAVIPYPVHYGIHSLPIPYLKSFSLVVAAVLPSPCNHITGTGEEIRAVSSGHLTRSAWIGKISFVLFSTVLDRNRERGFEREQKPIATAGVENSRRDLHCDPIVGGENCD